MAVFWVITRSNWGSLVMMVDLFPKDDRHDLERYI